MNSNLLLFLFFFLPWVDLLILSINMFTVVLLGNRISYAILCKLFEFLDQSKCNFTYSECEYLNTVHYGIAKMGDLVKKQKKWKKCYRANTRKKKQRKHHDSKLWNHSVSLYHGILFCQRPLPLYHTMKKLYRQHFLWLLIESNGSNNEKYLYESIR